MSRLSLDTDINRLRKPDMRCNSIKNTGFIDGAGSTGPEDIQHHRYVLMQKNAVIRCNESTCHCKGTGFIAICHICKRIIHSCVWGCPGIINVGVHGDIPFYIKTHWIEKHPEEPVHYVYRETLSNLRAEELTPQYFLQNVYGKPPYILPDDQVDL